MVVLQDDPTTTAVNESLGCTLRDVVDAHSTACRGAATIAVTTRGVCARVARAAYGQMAGFDAVVMVNTDDSLPPFEGPITEIPETDPLVKYDVTVPFLGVRKSAGNALRAAESFTISPKDLANPGFEGYGSFSSAGPRSGDSALKPTVTAPGVSIASAAVGSGTGAVFLSGTSMAAPHVAGVAALGVQAHPDWTGQDVSAALVSTADPAEVAGYRLTLGGGLVDPAALVDTETFAYGDSARGRNAYRESTLSFGFAEVARDFSATRTVTVVNRGTSARTYTVGYEKTAESLPAKVTFDRKSVAVPAGGTATVRMTLAVKATDVPASVGATQANLAEVSGNVVLTSSDDTLRVGALLVPAAVDEGLGDWKAAPVVPDRRPPSSSPNMGAVIPGDADLYTWGLEDPEGPAHRGGFDLQAAGVQSLRPGQGRALTVFAVSTHDRYSNAASIEFDILIDTDRDGTDDLVVFSYDEGPDHHGRRQRGERGVRLQPQDGRAVVVRVPVRLADGFEHGSAPCPGQRPGQEGPVRLHGCLLRPRRFMGRVQPQGDLQSLAEAVHNQPGRNCGAEYERQHSRGCRRRRVHVVDEALGPHGRVVRQPGRQGGLAHPRQVGPPHEGLPCASAVRTEPARVLGPDARGFDAGAALRPSVG